MHILFEKTKSNECEKEAFDTEVLRDSVLLSAFSLNRLLFL
jgi:hypothetical protein